MSIAKDKILIVEDDKILSNMMYDKFTHEGFDVDLAHNGEEALDKVREITYKLVLLDILMPKMHGLEVLSHIRRDADIMEMPVIVLTALDSTERARQAKKLGAIEYLVKSSYSLNDVVKKVKESMK